MDLNKHTGKSFSDVSKEIQKKYEERYDPISLRGLMADMKQLRQQQDQVKAQQEAQAAQEQAQMQQEMQQQGIDPSLMTSMNQGAGIQGGMPQGGQDTGTFNREASSSYNEQFAWGGDFNDPLLGVAGNEMEGSYGFRAPFNMNPDPSSPFSRYLSGNNILDSRPQSNTPGPAGNYFNQQMPVINQQVDPRVQAGREGFANYSSPVNVNNIAQARKGSSATPVVAETKSRQDATAIGPTTKGIPINYTNNFTGGLANAVRSGDATSRGMANPSFSNPQSSTSGSTSAQGAGTGNTNRFGRDPLSYAPVLGGALAMINNKRAAPIERNFVEDNTSLLGQVTPRQTQFSNVNMDQVERGIGQQARGFTASNINASGGNAGSFMANELANQGNVMNAIANARLQAQGQDRQTQQMNAQEQARIDGFNQTQNAQMQQAQAQNQGLNAQLALQYDDIDARNEAAFRTNRNDAMQSMLGTLGSIGRENTTNNMILGATGYNSFGGYGGQGQNAMASIINMFKKLRKG
jgi:hypothetical protein